MQTKYTEEVLAPIVARSFSTTAVLRELGLKHTGGNHAHIGKVIKKLDLDTSHFKRQAHNKGKPARNKIPTEVYLRNEKIIASSKLRNRLLDEGYFEKKCHKCEAVDWLGQEVPLELHHIDCNHDNNNLSNLTILCPNCHAVEHYKK